MHEDHAKEGGALPRPWLQPSGDVGQRRDAVAASTESGTIKGM